jgi:hypothetical protein
MWQKGTAPELYDWQGALKYCDNLELAGHRDWRLPNVRELLSLADYERYSPAFDPIFEGDTARYWTSTTIGKFPYSAFDVFFYGGFVHFIEEKSDPGSVRAVRGP